MLVKFGRGKHAKMWERACAILHSFFEITDRRATAVCSTIYTGRGNCSCHLLYLTLKAYYRLKESAMHSANKIFQDDLNALEVWIHLPI